MIENFYLLQLKFIEFLTTFRGPVLDQFFLFLKFFDSTPYYLFLIITLFFLIPKKGIHLAYLFLFGVLVNSGLKDLFDLPRPEHMQKGISMFFVHGGGLPSGAAQFSFMLFYFMKSEIKSSLLTNLLFLFMLLVSFSRLYFAVHFPMDLVAGWLIGYILIKLYSKFFKDFLTLIPYKIIPRFFLFIVGLLIASLIGFTVFYFPMVISAYAVTSLIILFDIARGVPFPQSNVIDTQWIYELPWGILKILISIPFYFIIKNILEDHKDLQYLLLFPSMIFISFFVIEKSVQKVRTLI